MARPLAEIRQLRDKYNNCPVVYAGDIFDRWNAPPEVINFALNNLTPGYAVPGQHDLPNHNYDDIHRSAYGTLVNTGILINLEPGKPLELLDGLVLHAFPWGIPLKPIEHDGNLNVAVVHKFIWTKDTGYTGASQDSKMTATHGKLKGFDVAVFGDNHKGFIAKPLNGPIIYNCGGMMRRKTDERDYKPGCGLLHANGSVTKHYFDTKDDKFIERTEAEETVSATLDMSEFVKGLESLGGDSLDFRATMTHFMDDNKIDKRVREIITTGLNS